MKKTAIVHPDREETARLLASDVLLDENMPPNRGVLIVNGHIVAIMEFEEAKSAFIDRSIETDDYNH